MPIYDYECIVCHQEFTAIRSIAERGMAICSCGNIGGKIFNGTAPAVVLFRGGWYEHVGPEPVHCETPQELEDACARSGNRSNYLEEGIWSTSKGERARREDIGVDPRDTIPRREL